MIFVKEQLPNGWVVLEHSEECYTCLESKKIGKFVFDSFVCASCVERLGGEQFE